MCIGIPGYVLLLVGIWMFYAYNIKVLDVQQCPAPTNQSWCCDSGTVFDADRKVLSLGCVLSTTPGACHEQAAMYSNPICAASYGLSVPTKAVIVKVTDDSDSVPGLHKLGFGLIITGSISVLLGLILYTCCRR